MHARASRRWTAPLLATAACLAALVLPAAARADCSGARVTSLDEIASRVRWGHDVCLAAGSYTGSVDLRNWTRRSATVGQEGGATIHGQVRLNSGHLALDGLVIENPAGSGAQADCLRLQAVGATDIAISDSSVGPCARDAIRMAYNRGQHDTAVTITGNVLHDIGFNACTCYLSDGLFGDNLVQRVGNDALDLWGDGNTVSHNVFRDLVADPPSNHNDVLQTWQVAGDPATGDPLTNLVFERNVVDTVGGADAHGLMIRGGAANAGLTVRSNLFRDVGSIGMLFDGTADVTVLANTFVRAGAMDTMEWKAGATGSIDSNVFFEGASAGSEPWYRDDTSDPGHAYNLAWGGALLEDEDTGINADPLFMDPNGDRDADRDNDFRPTPSSPLVDNGDPAVTDRVDIDGEPISGGRLDIGAYELDAGSFTAPASP
jgi:hypothetical protein